MKKTGRGIVFVAAGFVLAAALSLLANENPSQRILASFPEAIDGLGREGIADSFGGEKRIAGADASRMNLLVISLDTMRADRIGTYGYEKARTPHIDALAEKGVIFADCYSPVPLTLPAHCSLFTGRYPLGHLVRDNGTFFLSGTEITLAETMEKEGYSTYAVVASYVLMAKFGLDQGFSVYDDSLDAGELLRNFYSEIKADMVYEKFNRWLTEKGEQPFFAWVHFYDPHAPYEPPDAFTEGNSLSELYDGEVAFTDVHVGKVIADLTERDLLESTIIVIVGDHGEAFGEHQEYGHSVFCYQENLKVPLIFYCPRLFPERAMVEERVCLIDVLPSLLEILGMDPLPGMHGKSFAGMLVGKEQKKDRTYYIESMYGKETLGWAPLVGIIDGPYKYISLPEPELYDLGKDNREKNNLFAVKRDIVRDLDEKLKKFMLEYSTTRGNVRRKLTPEDRRRLESLGYISSSSPSASRAIDPKRGVLALNRFNNANNFIEKGQLDRAEAELKDIAAQDPGVEFLPYYELMAKIYEIKSDHQKVIEIWREAVKVFPANERFRVSLAFKLLQVGKLDEAEALGLEITGIDDRSARGFILLGRVEEKKGDPDKALSYFERANRAEPNNVQLKLTLAYSLLKNAQEIRALEICQSILEERAKTNDPAYAGVLSRIGTILIEANRIDQAKKVLSDSVAVDDSNPEAWNNLGVVYDRKKDYPKALEAYERAVRLDPGFASAFNNLGTLYLRVALEREDPDMLPKAIASFDQAIRNDPSLASAYHGRASAFKFSGRSGDAILDWQKAIALQPDYMEAYFNLGLTFLERGEKSDALNVLNMCKKRFYGRLPASERERLDQLIAEAIR